jgi:hypothetical protein
VGFSRDVDESVRMRIAGLEGVLSAVKSNPRQLVVRFNVGNNAQEKLLEQIATMKVGATSLRETTSGLEDAYLSLVKETL